MLSRNVCPALRPRGPRLARIVVLARAPPRRQAEQRREHEPGDDAGDEQRADRCIGRDRIHHHHDRRRDEDAQRTGRRDDAGAEARREALLDHRRQEDRADRDDRRRRAARHGGEQRAGHDARQPETAVPVADHRRGEVDHPSRDAAVGQEVAGEDEERDRHDLEPLDAGEELERDRLDRHVVIVNRYVSTVRPSEIEIGIPVSIRPNSSAKMIHALLIGTPASLRTIGIAIRTGGISAGQREAATGPGTGYDGAHGLPPADRRRMEVGVQCVGTGFVDAFDVRDVMVRQLAGAREGPCHLQEAEAHQVRAERNAQVDDPLRHFEVG